MLYTLLWRPEACFNTAFNKFTAKITGGEFCHSELVFQYTKRQWMEILKSFTSGRIKERATSLSKRLADIFEKSDEAKEISLCFHTIWGSEMNLRLLTASDPYIFNRLPTNNNEATKCVYSLFNKEEQRVALGFCLSELHKKYDNVKAVLFWVPRFNCRRATTLPSKYFCSEFIVYCFHQMGFAKNHRPENTTPNDLPPILKEIDNRLSSRRM